MHYKGLRLYSLLILLLYFSVLGQTEAQAGAMAPPPNVSVRAPRVMVSFGDSITAGAFANTSANLPTSFLPSILNLANLQDLFRQQLLETAVENKQFWSWASGVAISSHYNRLKKYFRNSPVKDIQMINMAVSGSVASDVLLQVKKFAVAMQRAPSTEIAYVTLMVGANDTCNGVELVDSEAKLHEAFDVLAAIPQVGKMKILVSSMPQVYQLGERAIRNRVTGTFFLSCEQVRSNILKFCNPLTHWNTNEEYSSNVKKVQDMNALLADIVQSASWKHRNLDIHFSDALYKQQLTFGTLAADCFHPNIKGQQQVSEILWNDQPWFK